MSKLPTLRRRLTLKEAKRQQRATERVLDGHVKQLTKALAYHNNYDSPKWKQAATRYVMGAAKGLKFRVKQWEHTRSFAKSHRYGKYFPNVSAKQLQASYKRRTTAREIVHKITLKGGKK